MMIYSPLRPTTHNKEEIKLMVRIPISEEEVLTNGLNKLTIASLILMPQTNVMIQTNKTQAVPEIKTVKEFATAGGTLLGKRSVIFFFSNSARIVTTIKDKIMAVNIPADPKFVVSKAKLSGSKQVIAKHAIVTSVALTVSISFRLASALDTVTVTTNDNKPINTV